MVNFYICFVGKANRFPDALNMGYDKKKEVKELQNFWTEQLEEMNCYFPLT